MTAATETLDMTAVVEHVGGTIAKSRYESWDEHAKTIPWEEYLREDPAVGNLYLEDGHRDAIALLPFMTRACNAAGVRALRDAAAEVREWAPTLANLLEEHAQRRDWNGREVHVQVEKP